MLIDGCKTGLKLGHFPKIENLFNQKWAWSKSKIKNFLPSLSHKLDSDV